MEYSTFEWKILSSYDDTTIDQFYYREKFKNINFFTH